MWIGSLLTCLGCSERSLVKWLTVMQCSPPHYARGIFAFRHTVWVSINTLEFLFLTEFQVVNTFPGKRHPQLFSTMATLLVSGFDHPHGNHHDLEYKSCLWIHAEMQPWELHLLNPNLFKHYHFHNSPGELPPKVPNLQTGFRQNFNRFIKHLQWNRIKLFPITC